MLNVCCLTVLNHSLRLILSLFLSKHYIFSPSSLEKSPVALEMVPPTKKPKVMQLTPELAVQNLISILSGYHSEHDWKKELGDALKSFAFKYQELSPEAIVMFFADTAITLIEASTVTLEQLGFRNLDVVSCVYLDVYVKWRFVFRKYIEFFHPVLFAISYPTGNLPSHHSKSESSGVTSSNINYPHV